MKNVCTYRSLTAFQPRGVAGCGLQAQRASSLNTALIISTMNINTKKALQVVAAVAVVTAVAIGAAVGVTRSKNAKSATTTTTVAASQAQAVRASKGSKNGGGGKMGKAGKTRPSSAPSISLQPTFTGVSKVTLFKSTTNASRTLTHHHWISYFAKGAKVLC